MKLLNVAIGYAAAAIMMIAAVVGFGIAIDIASLPDPVWATRLPLVIIIMVINVWLFGRGFFALLDAAAEHEKAKRK